MPTKGSKLNPKTGKYNTPTKGQIKKTKQMSARSTPPTQRARSPTATKRK